MRARRLVVLASLFSVFAFGNASAAVFVVTFEGLKNLEQILNFYNGGTGSQGSSGANLGVSFGPEALAIIQGAAGGTGNFSHNPSGATIAFWLSGANLVMNVPAGFDTGFSFFYSSSVPATITIYDGVNGTGNVLGTVNLVAQNQANGCSDTTFCNWSAGGGAFGGTARSVTFGGSADQTGFDNITFGSSEPVVSGEPIPTLSEWAQLTLAIFMVVVAALTLRRRRLAA